MFEKKLPCCIKCYNTKQAKRVAVLELDFINRKSTLKWSSAELSIEQAFARLHSKLNQYTNLQYTNLNVNRSVWYDWVFICFLKHLNRTRKSAKPDQSTVQTMTKFSMITTVPLSEEFPRFHRITGLYWYCSGILSRDLWYQLYWGLQSAYTSRPNTTKPGNGRHYWKPLSVSHKQCILNKVHRKRVARRVQGALGERQSHDHHQDYKHYCLGGPLPPVSQHHRNCTNFRDLPASCMKPWLYVTEDVHKLWRLYDRHYPTEIAALVHNWPLTSRLTFELDIRINTHFNESGPLCLPTNNVKLGCGIGIVLPDSLWVRGLW